METQVDEVMVRNQVVVTVEGNIKHYPISQLGLDFESSSDEEILSAVANVVREELDLDMPTESFVVSRSADNQNISCHTKTELG